jgi:hypothetical protein
MKKYSWVIAILFRLPALSQTTVIIPAMADNTIYQNPPGNSNALGQNIFSGTNGGGSPRRGLIKFDVAANIPPGATILSATLTLNCNISRSITDNVSLHKVSVSWGEGSSDAGGAGDGGGVVATTGDATWLMRFFPSTAWTTAGGDFEPVASATTPINTTGFFTWNSVNMIADVQSWLNNPANNFGWILLCNETTISTARRFASRQHTVAANRPALSITYSTVMPVELTYFKARPHNPGVLLEWETTQEINNHYFEILHSPDGSIFSRVGKIFSQGDNTDKQQYQFIHDIRTPGNHFYKLSQVDIDGQRTRFNIEKIFIDQYHGPLKIFPQPVLNKFRVAADISLQGATYKIFNQLGSIVQSGILSNELMNIADLSPGVYYFCVFHGTKMVNGVRLIKNKD